MAAYLLFRDALGEARNREVYAFALTRREHFTHSRTSPSRLYPDWRKSSVVYEPALREFAAYIQTEIGRRLAHAIRTLGIAPFAVGNVELQLTSHHDGEYYHWHVDNGTRETQARQLTFVYYFHRVPRPFSGGELVIYPGTQEAPFSLEPENDTLVLFDAGTKHEVRPVRCPSGRFEDGRFTLNGWVRRREPARDYFDGKIFSLPRTLTRREFEPRPAASAATAAPAATVLPEDHRRCADDAGAEALALLDVYSALHRQSPHARAVSVRHGLSGPAFFEDHYFVNRPVLLRGAMKHSPAVGTWSPERFADRFGSVPIQITDGRSADPDYEVNFANTVRKVRLGELVARLRQEPISNDYYLVARNYFFEHPALAPLRREVEPPPDIIDTRDQRPGTMKLWLGPRGTVTPLHYDQHSILFAQIYGRKHFKLIPPFDSRQVYPRDRFYSSVDPERPDADRFPEFSRANVADVVVEPGDVLFLPVHWWHWVRSLDISISVTFSSFRLSTTKEVQHVRA